MALCVKPAHFVPPAFRCIAQVLDSRMYQWCTFTGLLVVIGALQDGYRLVPTSLYKSGYSLRQLPFHNLRLDAELH
jgi:hypothetical protein